MLYLVINIKLISAQDIRNFHHAVKVYDCNWQRKDGGRGVVFHERFSIEIQIRLKNWA